VNQTQEILRTSLSELRRPGESDLSGTTLSRVGRVALTLVIAVTNLIGAAAVFVIAYFVVPLPNVRNSFHLEEVNAIVAATYVVLAVPVGVALGSWRLGRLRTWLREDRPATLDETRLVLLAPALLFSIQVALWLIAAIGFGVLNSTYDSRLGARVGIVVALTGLVTAACAYLLTERLLRPAAARALAEAEPGRLQAPGVATRAVLAWLLSTGLPVGGVVAIGILGLSGDSTATGSKLGLAMVALGGTGIAVGLLATVIAARATADPVNSVRRALAEVEQGEFDVRVPVYDGTQIGQLQLGFNRMVKGLAERERIRNAFGTYVDPDVAEHILEEGTNLAGEQVEVTLMFIDIRDFTGFAEETPADQVVAAINELFEQMVAIIHEHGGRVDKFVGDGLLAVFGAPRRQEDHADQALAAAIEIAGRTSSEQGLSFGVGLNSGTVVAGNVGGAGRLEFSVIGDPVNVAARVEAATRKTGDAILLTESTKKLLSDGHPELSERLDLELKGKQEKVRIYAPAEAEHPATNEGPSA
jgi:adenylate cyclase